MERKQINIIADTLRASRLHQPALPSLSLKAWRASNIQWRRTAEAFADVIAITNPNFKRGRFMNACGYYDVTGDLETDCCRRYSYYQSKSKSKF